MADIRSRGFRAAEGRVDGEGEQVIPVSFAGAAEKGEHALSLWAEGEVLAKMVDLVR